MGFFKKVFSSVCRVVNAVFKPINKVFSCILKPLYQIHPSLAIAAAIIFTFYTNNIASLGKLGFFAKYPQLLKGFSALNRLRNLHQLVNGVNQVINGRINGFKDFALLIGNVGGILSNDLLDISKKYNNIKLMLTQMGKLTDRPIGVIANLFGNFLDNQDSLNITNFLTSIEEVYKSAKEKKEIGVLLSSLELMNLVDDDFALRLEKINPNFLESVKSHSHLSLKHSKLESIGDSVFNSVLNATNAVSKNLEKEKSSLGNLSKRQAQSLIELELRKEQIANNTNSDPTISNNKYYKAVAQSNYVQAKRNLHLFNLNDKGEIYYDKKSTTNFKNHYLNKKDYYNQRTPINPEWLDFTQKYLNYTPLKYSRYNKDEYKHKLGHKPVRDCIDIMKILKKVDTTESNVSYLYRKLNTYTNQPNSRLFDYTLNQAKMINNLWVGEKRYIQTQINTLKSQINNKMYDIYGLTKKRDFLDQINAELLLNNSIKNKYFYQQNFLNSLHKHQYRVEKRINSINRKISKLTKIQENHLKNIKSIDDEIKSFNRLHIPYPDALDRFLNSPVQKIYKVPTGSLLGYGLEQALKNSLPSSFEKEIYFATTLSSLIMNKFPPTISVNLSSIKRNFDKFLKMAPESLSLAQSKELNKLRMALKAVQNKSKRVLGKIYTNTVRGVNKGIYYSGKIANKISSNAFLKQHQFKIIKSLNVGKRLLGVCIKVIPIISTVSLLLTAYEIYKEYDDNQEYYLNKYNEIKNEIKKKLDIK